ncbi:MAG: hypothetical protein IJC09_00855 [Clostridia bacterium]|nr:hypothetical protein [Clostridia bacterium]
MRRMKCRKCNNIFEWEHQDEFVICPHCSAKYKVLNKNSDSSSDGTSNSTDADKEDFRGKISERYENLKNSAREQSTRFENMFKKASKRKIPKSIDDCTEVDPVSEELWGWAESTERWGKILLVIYILYGIITAITTAIVVDAYGSPDGFNVALCISGVIKCAIYAVLAYILYHLIALLIASLATITQSTRVTAKLTEYRVRKAENYFPTDEEMKKYERNEDYEKYEKEFCNNLSELAKKTDNSK